MSESSHDITHRTAFPLDVFRSRETPFYYYDLDLLRLTLAEIRKCMAHNYRVHYAVKACATPEVLRVIAASGFGADCVSGGEVQAALDAGIPAEKIVFAGVSKSDKEIRLGLEKGIACFNVESIPELEVIAQMATEMGVKAHVALRINPNVDAHTHKKITTGLQENKFGIALSDMDKSIDTLLAMPSIVLEGLHFHIGSQITDFTAFRNLSVRVNEIVEHLEQRRICIHHINVGGGLGVDYQHPNYFPVPDFEGYFRVFKRVLQLRDDQTLHFELGRAVVAQCGSLITRVLYIKTCATKQFAMVDAGMTDLIRPAMYDAFHKIENLTPTDETALATYDVVGPICESSDVFIEGWKMPVTKRGDLLAIRTAGAYGEVMAMQYNMRRLPGHMTSEDI